MADPNRPYNSRCLWNLRPSVHLNLAVNKKLRRQDKNSAAIKKALPLNPHRSCQARSRSGQPLTVKVFDVELNLAVVMAQACEIRSMLIRATTI